MVMMAKYCGQWLFCKHRERTTYEIPGGHREEGESALEAARRELYEETGALSFEIQPVCIYGVCRAGEEESLGMLYYAEIHELGALPQSEIEAVERFDALPESLTYPFIQPHLYQKVMAFLENIV